MVVFFSSMPFRSAESAEEGAKNAVLFLTRHLAPDLREPSAERLRAIIAEHGPVVTGYPHWHPLVSHSLNPRAPVTDPRINIIDEKGHSLLDHTILLRNGFITCPYNDPQELIKWVQGLEKRTRQRLQEDSFRFGAQIHLENDATLCAELLDFPLYAENASPVLVTCQWSKDLDRDGMIPASIAIPRLLEIELPSRHHAEVAETWETMRSYILGQPCGARSSHFISPETGTKLKTMWNTLMSSGAFGEFR
jgi:hypothetical protein